MEGIEGYENKIYTINLKTLKNDIENQVIWLRKYIQ